jgi:hypothetical protein
MLINNLAILLAAFYYVRLRSGLLLQKFIIKDHQLRIRDMFTTFYFMPKAMLTKRKVKPSKSLL